MKELYYWSAAILRRSASHWAINLHAIAHTAPSTHPAQHIGGPVDAEVNAADSRRQCHDDRQKTGKPSYAAWFERVPRARERQVGDCGHHGVATGKAGTVDVDIGGNQARSWPVEGCLHETCQHKASENSYGNGRASPR